MRKSGFITLATLVVYAIFFSVQAGAEQEDFGVEKLREIIENQQQEISELKTGFKKIEEKVELTGDMIDNLGSHASSGNKTTLGGYGELHYNNLDYDGIKADKREIDFHRFVLFVSHDYSDTVRFFSELELEHSLSGEGKPGEVELEQAYVDIDLNDNHTVRAGLFMIPVGIMNETHEPPTFYGVERNPVEKNIIPATWWETGAALTGKITPAVSYDLALTSGLNHAYKIRSGRQKGSKAVANDLAYTGRLKWTGMPGVEVGGTVQYQENITQGTDPDASATLVEGHAVANKGAFGLRLLYASWTVDGIGAKGVGMDEQTGWYVEPSYRVTEQFGFFARYNFWDNSAGDSNDSEYSQTEAGINYWPDEDVVVKVDYLVQDAPQGKDDSHGFNIGIGYQF